MEISREGHPYMERNGDLAGPRGPPLLLDFRRIKIETELQQQQHTVCEYVIRPHH